MADVYNYGEVEDEASITEIAAELGKSQSKDETVKLLKKVISILENRKQSEGMRSAVKPLARVVSQLQSQQQTDKGIKIYLSVCFVQILRMSAPESPFDEASLSGLFQLVLNVLALLGDTAAATYHMCVSMLQSFAKVKCGLLMWDLENDALVENLFETLISSVSGKNFDDIGHHVLEILCSMLEEADDIPSSIVETFLDCLEIPQSNPGRTRLVQGILKRQEATLGMYLQKALIRVIEAGGGPYHSYENLLLAVHQSVPQLLLPVLPHLHPQLEADEDAVRGSAVHVVGQLFSCPQADLAVDYPELLKAFLRRFIDHKVDIRIDMLSLAPEMVTASTCIGVRSQVAEAAAARLLDTDERVRAKAVRTVCCIGCKDLALVSDESLQKAVGRLRDAKAYVRREAAAALVQLFRTCCQNISDGSTAELTEPILRIPTALLLNAACDPDSSTRASQEHVLQDGLFPPGFPSEEAAYVLAEGYRFSDECSRKSLLTLLTKKRRFRVDLEKVLRLRRLYKSTHSKPRNLAELEEATIHVSKHFPDPLKAAEHLSALLALKDNTISKKLLQLATESRSSKDEEQMTADVEKRFSGRKVIRDFAREICQRLRAAPLVPGFAGGLVSIVQEQGRAVAVGTRRGALDLLELIAAADPSMLCGLLGSLVDVLMCLESGEDVTVACKILAHCVCTIAKDDAESRAVFGRVKPVLSEICCRGPAPAAKFAGRAMASFSESCKMHVEIFEDLVLALPSCNPSNCQKALSLLRAMSGVARRCPGMFTPNVRAMRDFVFKAVLPCSGTLSVPCETWNSPSDLTALKAAALKLLARAFVPENHAIDVDESMQRPVEETIAELDRLLDPANTMEHISVTGNVAQAHIRLASATAMLQLARRYEFLFSPQLYVNLSLAAQDPVREVRQAFIEKLYKTADFFEVRGMRSIASKYMSILSLSAMDPVSSSRKLAAANMEKFVVARRRSIQAACTAEACASADGGSNLPDQPEFMLAYGTYVLAHHPDFPEAEELSSGSGEDLKPWEKMMSFLLRPLLQHESTSEHGSSLPAIFKLLLTLKLSGDTLVNGINENICCVCDIGLRLCGGEQRWKSLPPFPAKVPLPRAFYQPADRTATFKNRRFGSHLPEGYRVESEVLDAIAGRRGRRRGLKRDGAGGKSAAPVPVASPTAKVCGWLLNLAVAFEGQLPISIPGCSSQDPAGAVCQGPIDFHHAPNAR